MRYLSLVLIAIIAISVPVLAQCSTLAMSGSINAGQTITIDVSGASANAIALIAAGDAGSSTINLPGSALNLGVASVCVSNVASLVSGTG